jgi:uncharacterized protein YkwD
VLLVLLGALLLVGPAPDPPYSASQAEAALGEAVNATRAAHGLAPFRLDDRLADLSRTHSADMIARRYFDHRNPEGQDPRERAEAAGFTCRHDLDANTWSEGVSENLYFIRLASGWSERDGVRTVHWRSLGDVVGAVVTGWMESPPHRRTLLLEPAEAAGVGVAISDEDELLVTLNVC